jgi:hypothetical protein
MAQISTTDIEVRDWPYFIVTGEQSGPNPPVPEFQFPVDRVRDGLNGPGDIVHTAKIGPVPYVLIVMK